MTLRVAAEQPIPADGVTGLAAHGRRDVSLPTQPVNIVKDELSSAAPGTAKARRAEVAVMLRLTGGLAIIGNMIVLDAELDHLPSAQRLRNAIHHLCGATPTLKILRGSTGSTHRYLLRVTHAENLARQTGLIDHRNRPVSGIPPWIVGGSREELEAAWRGAILATGHLASTGHRRGITVYSPGPEAAIALAGIARRLGITAQRREVRGRDCVVLRSDETVTTLLAKIGAPETSASWANRHHHQHPQTGIGRSPTLESANTRRAAEAAAESTARVRRAMQILGDSAPTHLKATAALRLANPDLALSELGLRADPPMTKDAVAGRIRRLLDLADRTAKRAGIPDTTTAARTAGSARPATG
ncbi:DNA-binding protein WhiA [Mycolicibacterium sp. 22603]|uniref:DNA-binding protein WhiA n=1 Tax=Mycolicibacterium sp. 22603 TaxID=3453950 RepID=UPI003F8329A5